MKSAREQDGNQKRRKGPSFLEKWIEEKGFFVSTSKTGYGFQCLLRDDHDYQVCGVGKTDYQAVSNAYLIWKAHHKAFYALQKQVKATAKKERLDESKVWERFEVKHICKVKKEARKCQKKS